MGVFNSKSKRSLRPTQQGGLKAKNEVSKNVNSACINDVSSRMV